MRRHVRYAIGGRAGGARVAFRLTVPAALVAASIGSALAAASPAAAAAGGAAAPSCTVHWVAKDFPPMWTDPKNWSTGKLPGPADDVCITNTGDDVLTTTSIDVHSLLLGSGAGIAMEGSTSHPLTATVATSITMGSGGRVIDLTDASINAAEINGRGGTIYTDGNCNLTSPDIVLGTADGLQAANGTTVLTSLPQLSNGTLTGATIHTAGATVVLPGGITHLVGANVTVGANSEIKDAAGHNALTGLTSIDPASSLLVASNLTLTGGLSASGNVTVEGADLALGSPYTQAQGLLTVQVSGNLSASQVTIGSAGTLFNVYGGGGTITGNLVNDGSVVAGVTQVNGNYTQAPGASLFSGFGQLLTVTGQANLAGSACAAELFAKQGDTSPLIKFGSISGSFTSHCVGITLSTGSHEVDAVVTPQVAASPATVAPGQTVTVDGGGFTYPEGVRIFLHSVSGRPLATTGVGVRGNFVSTFTVPSFTAAGPQKVIAVGSDGARATTTITVS